MKREFIRNILNLWFPIGFLIILNNSISFEFSNNSLLFLFISFLIIIVYYYILTFIKSSHPFHNNIALLFSDFKFPIFSYIYLFIRTIFFVSIFLYISLLSIDIVENLFFQLFSLRLNKYIILISIIIISTIYQKDRFKNHSLYFILIIFSLIVILFSNNYGNTNELSPLFFIPFLLIFFLNFQKLDCVSSKDTSKDTLRFIISTVIFFIIFLIFEYRENIPIVKINYTVNNLNIIGILNMFVLLILTVFFNSFFFSNSFHEISELQLNGFIKKKSLKIIQLIQIPILIITGVISLYYQIQNIWINIFISMFLLSLSHIGILSIIHIYRVKNIKIFDFKFISIISIIGIMIPIIYLFFINKVLIAGICLSIILILFFLFGKRNFYGSKNYKEYIKKSTKKRKNYKILIPLSNPETASFLIKVGQEIAKKKDAEIVSLRVSSSISNLKFLQSQNKLELEIEKHISDNISFSSITQKALDPVKAICETVSAERIDLLIIGWSEINGVLSPILKSILEKATCDVLVVKKGDENLKDSKKVILPWNKDSSPPWLEFAEIFKESYGIDYEFIKIKGKNKYYLSNSEFVANEISLKADNKSIVIIGNDAEGVFQKLSLGNISIQLAHKVNSIIFLSRPFPGIFKHWLRRIIISLDTLLPDVQSEDKPEFYKQLVAGAQPNIDYYIMIILSSIIATLGLLLNSPAVVIGAMLVAPLMTPLVSLAFGITKGNKNILVLSLQATIKGVVIAIAISFILTLLFPLDSLPDIIMSRTKPSILDLIIAIASGIAGAYAFAHGKVRAALPGVAIAAALMPPICTIGITLAFGNALLSGGAFLLFIVNLIGISFSAGVILLFLGLHPEEKEHYRKTKKTIFIGFISVILVGLILFSISKISIVGENRVNDLKLIIKEEIEKKDCSLVEIEMKDISQDSMFVSITIASEVEPSDEEIEEWERFINLKAKKNIRFEIIYLKLIKKSSN